MLYHSRASSCEGKPGLGCWEAREGAWPLRGYHLFSGLKDSGRRMRQSCWGLVSEPGDWGGRLGGGGFSWIHSRHLAGHTQ